MMEDTMDTATGELFDHTAPVSERAIAAGNRSRAMETVAALGIGNAELYAALMAAVGKMPVWITTDKDGAHKVKYATLKQILETVRPILLGEGIRIRQGADRSFMLDEGGGVKGRLVPVYTDLIHSETGQVDRTTIEIPLVKLDAQAMGSAVTYGRRYSLLAALGLATDEADDDGEGAKVPSLTDRANHSHEYTALIKEMDAIKSAGDLAEWGNDGKQRKRLARLPEGEVLLAKKHFEERGRALLNAAEEEPAPSGKSKK